MEEAVSSACEWYSASLLIFSENVGPLVYYAHLLPLIASLLLGFFVILASRRALVHWVLFFMTLMFSAWVYFDLILWASPSPELVLFFWSIMDFLELLIYASCLYLVYLFCNDQKDISIRTKLAMGAFFIPVILFAHTGYNVLGLSPDCDEGAIEGPLIHYVYVVGIMFIIWIAAISARGYSKISDPLKKKQLLTISVGTIAFLLLFTAGNITLIFSLGPSYEQYKLFGMPIFAGFVAYSVLRFKTFDARVFTAQVLIIATAILIFSLLFLQTIENVRIVTVITFALVCVLGYVLIKSVGREIEQRELIELQEKELEIANREQESLFHFISHQIKGYLTKSEAGFAALAEGDYGVLSDAQKVMSRSALSEVRRGVATVMEILDASNFKKGTVSYTKKPFDFKTAVSRVIEELMPSAIERELALDFSADEGVFTVTGDEDKLKQHAIRNLIDNAIRYTPTGGRIQVRLMRTGRKLRFSVEDSGVGITPEDMKRLFTEGGHGKDSIRVNVHSTGYGLYVAKKVVEAHDGTIWVESEGTGKGSRFIVELPVS